jgi:hypothetical protein
VPGVSWEANGTFHDFETADWDDDLPANVTIIDNGVIPDDFSVRRLLSLWPSRAGCLFLAWVHALSLVGLLPQKGRGTS